MAEAMRTMDSNLMGVVFVERDDVLVGSFSDGDARRALLADPAALQRPVADVMNRQPVVLDHRSSAEETYACLAAGEPLGRRVFPRVDEEMHIQSFAYRGDWGHFPISEPIMAGNEMRYVMECMESNWISSTGRFVGEFEQAFAAFTGLRNPVAVSNGTVALTLALLAMGIPTGAEVIVPTFTFAASANAVVAAGGVPVLADVDPDTWGLSVDTINRVATSNTWGVMGVHLFGNPMDSQAVADLCRSRGWRFLEDCAEAIGTRVGELHAGGHGDAAAFSFFGNKTLTTGEGGMVMFTDAHEAETARVLRDHGMSRTRKYWHERVGYNMRLTNLQAAIGLAQVERATELVATKLKLGAAYSKAFQNSGIVTCLSPTKLGVSSYWLFPVLLPSPENRDSVMQELAGRGIQTRIVFPPLDLMPAFASFRRDDNLKVSHSISARGICLPSTPSMSADQATWIAETLLEFFA